jgi:hypothetical protein
MKLFGDQLTDMKNKMSRASNQTNLLSKLVYTYIFIKSLLRSFKKHVRPSTTTKNVRPDKEVKYGKRIYC